MNTNNTNKDALSQLKTPTIFYPLMGMVIIMIIVLFMVLFKVKLNLFQ